MREGNNITLYERITPLCTSWKKAVYQTKGNILYYENTNTREFEGTKSFPYGTMFRATETTTLGQDVESYYAVLTPDGLERLEI